MHVYHGQEVRTRELMPTPPPGRRRRAVSSQEVLGGYGCEEIESEMRATCAPTYCAPRKRSDATPQNYPPNFFFLYRAQLPSVV